MSKMGSMTKNEKKAALITTLLFVTPPLYIAGLIVFAMNVTDNGDARGGIICGGTFGVIVAGCVAWGLTACWRMVHYSILRKLNRRDSRRR